jgi:hypothetical protein
MFIDFCISISGRKAIFSTIELDTIKNTTITSKCLTGILILLTVQQILRTLIAFTIAIYYCCHIHKIYPSNLSFCNSRKTVIKKDRRYCEFFRRPLNVKIMVYQTVSFSLKCHLLNMRRIFR